VETGRSCVHPDHRTGAVVGLVWAGIARYMLLSGHSWLAGCASVPLADGGALAAGVWDVVRRKHLAADEYRVVPRVPWDVDGVDAPARPVVPPLLRGYLRLGAWVCGRPALDADFGVADFFVLLSLANVDQRYLKFFLGES
jgi:putative hemolysin